MHWRTAETVLTYDCDLAIVGSGFGASLLAMIGRRLGLKVMLIERGQHPRFAIGESASPLAGVLIEQLADRYDLPRLKPLASYGAWRRSCPHLVCGLKRGFTYYKHEAGRTYRAAPDRSNQLLVAASPSDEVADTHWLRADVDHFLVREAAALGVEYVDRTQLDGLEWDAAGAPVLHGERTGRRMLVRARALVDGTGPRGWISRTLPLGELPFSGYPRTQALFSHFVGVARCAEMPDYATTGRPPYPVDDAALHHVLDEGWMWVLRFGNGVTSAGVALSERLAGDLRLADGEAAWQRLLARYPSLAAQFAEAVPIREFTWMPRLSYRAAVAGGERWALLPSAAAFVDPLFSTGIPLTLLGIERIGRALETGRLPGARHTEAAGPGASALDLESCGAAALGEAERTARFIAGCYAAFPRFEVFTAYAMFYFAAASFGEMARRLARPGGGGPPWLGAGHPGFAVAMDRLSPALLGASAVSPGFERAVAAAVDSLNVAGLADATKLNWYGANLEDAVRGAAKLGATTDEVTAALAAAWA